GRGDIVPISPPLSPVSSAPPALPPAAPWRCPPWGGSRGPAGAACPCPPGTSCGGRQQWRSQTRPPSRRRGRQGGRTGWCWQAKVAWGRQRWPASSGGCRTEPPTRTSTLGEAGGWLQESCLQTGDAFLLVFSVTDRRSFSRIPQTLLRLREGSPHPDPPVILVGNKSDLARSREVSLEEGRSLAVMLSCKHIETSAALHHNTR
uniref:Small monomeric GTPase n=1 Tax=Chelonoidis abingdonii TaxID=106734 RepID=A0A8C0GR85_CHEAB